MNLDHLRYFVEAARQRHFGRAAKILGVTPSAVSHGVSNLEAFLGKPLFVKDGKSVALTSTGAALLERGARLLGDARRMVDELAGDSADLRETFRFGATHGFVAAAVGRALCAVQRSRPFVADFVSLRSADVLAGVSNGELDLGVCLSPQRLPRIQTQRLHEGSLGVFVRRGHPLLGVKKPVGALSRWPACLPKAFAGVDPCEHHPVFEAHAVTPEATVRVDSYDLMASVVAASDAWGFFPDLAGRGHPGLVALPLPRTWNATYQVAAVWKSGEPPFRVLVELADAVAKELTAVR